MKILALTILFILMFFKIKKYAKCIKQNIVAKENDETARKK